MRTHAGGFYLEDNPMRDHNEYMARVALCEQRAKDARTENEKQSWLVMADSWRETVKLQEILTRQAEFIRKVPIQRAQALNHDHRYNQHQSACGVPVLRQIYAFCTNSAKGGRPPRNADIRVQIMPPCGYGRTSAWHY